MLTPLLFLAAFALPAALALALGYATFAAFDRWIFGNDAGHRPAERRGT